MVSHAIWHLIFALKVSSFFFVPKFLPGYRGNIEIRCDNRVLVSLPPPLLLPAISEQCYTAVLNDLQKFEK